MAQAESVRPTIVAGMTRPVRIALPLAIAALMTVFAFWVIDSSSSALTDMKDDLALSGTAAGLAVSCFFGGRLIGNLPAAKLIQRSGPALAAMGGGVAIAAGGLAAAMANGAPLLLPARLLEGIGVACLINAALVSILRARQGAGSAMPMFTFLSTTGSVIGISSGGGVTEWSSWRAVFVLHAIIGVAAVVGGRLGWNLGLIAATSPAPEDVRSEPPVARHPEFFAGLAMNFLVYINYSVWAVALPLYLDHRFHATAERISALLLVVTVGHLAFAYPVGAMVHRIGPARAVVVGNAVTALSLLLTLAPSGIWMLIPPLVLYALGQVISSNAAGDLILQRAPGAGAVSQLRLSGDVGMVIGPVAVGALADVAGYGSPYLALPVVTALLTAAAIAYLRSKPA